MLKNAIMKKTVFIFFQFCFLLSFNMQGQLLQTDEVNFKIITGMDLVTPGIKKTIEKKYSYEPRFGEMKKTENKDEIKTVYNENGLPLEKEGLYWSNKTQIKYEDTTIKEIRYPKDEWIIWKFKTDEKGHITEKNEYSTSGTLAKSWSYEYNSKGQIIKRVLNKNNDSNYPEKLITEFKYNSSGNLENYYTYAETSNPVGKLHREKKKFIYNSNDILVQTIEAFSHYGSKTPLFPKGLDFQHSSGRTKTINENRRDMQNSWSVTIINEFEYSDKYNLWNSKTEYDSVDNDDLNANLRKGTLIERKFLEDN